MVGIPNFHFAYSNISNYVCVRKKLVVRVVKAPLWYFFISILSLTFMVLLPISRNGEIVTNSWSEAYSEPCQTSNMECFAKIVNSFSKNTPS